MQPRAEAPRSPSPATNLTSNPTTPPFADDVEWITAYLTIHVLSDQSRIYGYILWFVIAAVVSILSIMRAVGLRGGYLNAYWTKWALRRRTWRKKHGIALAQKRGQPHRQPIAMPSNAQILCLVALIVGSLALSFIGPDYLAPGFSLLNVFKSSVAPIDKRDTSEYAMYQPQYTIRKAWWTSGGRTGLIAFALLPVCVLFALKSPPFAVFSIPFFTQIYFDKLAWLHRCAGILVWVVSASHVVLWSIQLAKDRRNGTDMNAYTYAWQYEKFIYGWLAFGLMTLLLASSVPWIRRYHYEAFYFLHLLLVPLSLILSAMHHPPVWWWCWSALALWVGERIYRGAWWLRTNGFFGGMEPAIPPTKLKKKPSVKKGSPVTPDVMQMKTIRGRDRTNNPTIYPISPPAENHTAEYTSTYSPPPGFAHCELLPGRTVRVRLVTPTFLSWAPGQHFLINIPAISKYTSHPFTVASVCDRTAPGTAGRELVFLIRAKNGWTKDLWQTVAVMCAHGQRHPHGEKMPARCQYPSRGVLMRGYADGPFGSAVRAKWRDHSTVMIVAGGSGVSFGLSVLQYMCLCLAGRDGKELGGQSGGWGKPEFKTTRVRFIWLVREFGHVMWAAPVLRQCLALVPPSELQVDIFVTNIKLTLRAPPPPRPPSPPGNFIIGEDGIDDLAPPSPGFARGHNVGAGRGSQDSNRTWDSGFMRENRNAGAERGHSTSLSLDSVSSEESEDSMLDLSYYSTQDADVQDPEEEDILDLTNFDGDDDTALPGEAFLNMTVKREGRMRRSYMRRTSVAVAARQELEIRTSMYRSSRIGIGSTVRLMDSRPTSFVLPPFAPLAERSEHARHAGPSRPFHHSTLARLEEVPNSAIDVTTPNSAAPLMGTNQKFVFPPPESKRISHQSTTSVSQEGAPARPVSVISQGSVFTQSDAHSLAALVSAAAAKEQLRIELDEEELADISVVAEHARPGKPKLDRILADEVQQAKGSIVVGCCGPTSLSAVMRKYIAAQIDPGRIRQGDMRGSIALVTEDFEY